MAKVELDPLRQDITLELLPSPNSRSSESSSNQSSTNPYTDFRNSQIPTTPKEAFEYYRDKHHRAYSLEGTPPSTTSSSSKIPNTTDCR